MEILPVFLWYFLFKVILFPVPFKYDSKIVWFFKTTKIYILCSGVAFIWNFRVLKVFHKTDYLLIKVVPLKSDFESSNPVIIFQSVTFLLKEQLWVVAMIYVVIILFYLNFFFVCEFFLLLLFHFIKCISWLGLACWYKYVRRGTFVNLSQIYYFYCQLQIVQGLFTE